MQNDSTASPPRPLGLEREIAVFKARLPEFLADHDGEFVLIRGDQVHGFYPTWEEALNAGYDRIGLPPFLVKQVLAVEPAVRLPYGG